MPVPEFRPGQRVCLESLSNEVLSMIAQCVCDLEHPSRRNLKAGELLEISLCSKRMHSAFEPAIYAEFAEDTRWKLPRKVPKLCTFLCRIVARPDLAKRVQKYTGYAKPFSPGHGEAVDVSSIAEEDWVLIRAVIEKHPLGADSKLRNAEKGSWDAMTALVLYLLPNIEELEFEAWGGYGNGFPSVQSLIMLAADDQLNSQRPTTSPPLLSKLRHVSVSYGFPEGGMYFCDFDNFLTLKSLRSMAVRALSIADDDETDHNINEHWDPESTMPLWMRSLDYSHITDLSLSETVIDAITLVHLLRCFPNLRRLVYGHGTMSVGPAIFRAPRFMQGLEHLKPCLEDLSISRDEVWETHASERHSIGSFAEFTSLKTLRITADILLGGHHMPDVGPPPTIASALPPNIENLTLDRDKSYDTEIPLRLPDYLEFFTHIKEFPRLKSLDLGWDPLPWPDTRQSIDPFTDPSFTMSDATVLADLCEEAGIALTFQGREPPARLLHHWINPKVDQMSTSMPSATVYTRLRFLHPWKSWRRYCQESDCDPATGKWFGIKKSPLEAEELMEAYLVMEDGRISDTRSKGIARRV